MFLMNLTLPTRVTHQCVIAVSNITYHQACGIYQYIPVMLKQLTKLMVQKCSGSTTLTNVVLFQIYRTSCLKAKSLTLLLEIAAYNTMHGLEKKHAFMISYNSYSEVNASKFEENID